MKKALRVNNFIELSEMKYLSLMGKVKLNFFANFSHNHYALPF